MMKYWWRFISFVAIPFDYFGWNMVFGSVSGYISYKDCIRDRKKILKEMGITL